MELKHTQEPWEFVFSVILNAHGHEIVQALGVQTTTMEDMETARRIVACVNACAGMENPAEEISGLRDEANRLQRENIRLNTLRVSERLALEKEVSQLRADRERVVKALRQMKTDLYRQRMRVPVLNECSNSLTRLEGEIEELLSEMEGK